MNDRNQWYRMEDMPQTPSPDPVIDTSSHSSSPVIDTSSHSSSPVIDTSSHSSSPAMSTSSASSPAMSTSSASSCSIFDEFPHTHYERAKNKYFESIRLVGSIKPKKPNPSDPNQIKTRFQIDLSSKMKRKDKRTQRIIFAEAAMFTHSIESLLKATELKIQNSKTRNFFGKSVKILDYIHEMITNNRLIHTPLNKIIAINDDGKIDCRLCNDIDGLMADITEQIGAMRNYMCPICYSHFFDGRWYNEQEYYSYKREAWEVRDDKFDERINTHRKQDQI